MTTQGHKWTGQWVAGKMRTHENVVSIDELGPQHIRIVRKQYAALTVGTLACEQVNLQEVQPIISGQLAVAFIVNVPKESYVTGEALRFGEANGVPIGGLGDLMRAIRLADVSRYVNKETEFLERGLQQHTRVLKFQRVHDRKYAIQRDGLSELTVVFLNEYELTADHVRTARARYGLFDIVVATNPNGNPTSSAETAAKSLGATIYKWGPFLGALNQE